MTENFENKPENAIPADNEPKVESKAEVDPLVGLTPEQVGGVVDRVIKLMSKKAEASTDLDIEKAKLDMDREDVFNRGLDKFILSRLNKIGDPKINQRLDKRLDDAYAETEKYRQNLASGVYKEKKQ